MELMIANICIRQDELGRYCLNDLHRAAGGEKKHQPANWLRLETTQSLAEEVSNSSDMRNKAISVLSGNQGGTFVAKQLVYAYAMWISPSFHLKVINTFDAVATQHQLPSDPVIAQLQILQHLREQQLALESGLHVVATGISETRNDVNHLKQNMRVENWQQCNIKDAVHAKASEFHELYPTSDYGDIIRKIWRFFKNKFKVPRYQELPAMMYEEGMKTIRNLEIRARMDEEARQSLQWERNKEATNA